MRIYSCRFLTWGDFHEGNHEVFCFSDKMLCEVLMIYPSHEPSG